jgi:hypothetical protein
MSWFTSLNFEFSIFSALTCTYKYLAAAAINICGGGSSQMLTNRNEQFND